VRKTSEVMAALHLHRPDETLEVRLLRDGAALSLSYRGLAEDRH